MQDLNAAREAVQQVFVAFYNRPADPEGLHFWSHQLFETQSLDGIIDAFANSAETQARYGEISEQNIEEVINNIYESLFDRPADQGGLEFYAQGFAQGDFTPGSIALNILNGAQNEDLELIDSKVDVAQTFTNLVETNNLDYAGDEAAAAARDFLADISEQGLPEQQVLEFLNQIFEPVDPEIPSDPEGPAGLMGTYELTDFYIDVASERINPELTQEFTGHMVITEDHMYRGVDFVFNDGSEEGIRENAPLAEVDDHLLFAGLDPVAQMGGYNIEYSWQEELLAMYSMSEPVPGTVFEEEFVWQQVDAEPDFAMLQPYGIQESDAQDMWG